MTESLREQAQYRKGKTPIMREYLNDHKKLLADIAGRGFLILPGYAYDAENRLELAAKTGLSELNYKILAETIERGIRQAGFNYNLGYQTALMAWEMEKQSLMAAWDKELAGIRLGMAEEEEMKNILSTEVEARQTVLINAKTAIELEMESCRKQIAELEDAAAPYDVRLANARLLTAQKKLDLIPVIQEIIGREKELLALERDKSDEYAKLAAVEQEAAAKRQRLVPELANLVSMLKQHADLIPWRTAVEKQIAAEKLAQARLQKEISRNKVEEMKAGLDGERTKIGLAGAQRELKILQFEKGQELVLLEADKENEYQNALDASHRERLEDERRTLAALWSDRTELNKLQNDAAYAGTVTLTQAGIEASKGVTDARLYQEERMADIAKSQKVTATLEHLIG